MPNIGKYDRLLVIQKPVFVRDETGQEVLSGYTYFASIWAKRVEKTGSENQEAAQKVGSAQYMFEGRYVPGITNKMVISNGGVVYNINYVSETLRGHVVQILATIKDN